ncbi:hypothetical protein HQQ80_19030 [Microbacteriaceae bacterium VKM Ac-2855]|nr:hypothetical protein [Microbacteriaceae bacterium VKM Ac-2855]
MRKLRRLGAVPAGRRHAGAPELTEHGESIMSVFPATALADADADADAATFPAGP